MNEHETQLSNTAARKAKIRERYRGISQDELEVIPAIEDVGLDDESVQKRVAVYVRVSTDDPNQTSSYELQKNHYQDMVNRHPGWTLINIYADEGISGTSLNHRDQFVEMIKACEKGDLDLIITKSVSRFARNVLDCIGEVRKLAALPHPVGVLFETENLYTLNKNSEMALSFISTLAQEESHTKSDIMNASIEMRFSRGIFLTPVLLGYDLDDNGMLIVNEDEALTVRLIFFMYLCGCSTVKIASTLMALGRKTKPGNLKWTSASILQILQNERYCGDVLAHKTYTPNYLTHKSEKNRQKRPQYRQRDHHEPIISRDDFISVQKLVANAKYGYKGCLPSIEVINDGIFTGFVIINTRWAGFKKQEYFDAIQTVCEKPLVFDDNEDTTIEGNIGDFDLRGFQVVHGLYFRKHDDIYVTITNKDILFSKTCAIKLDNKIHAELLFDPVHKLLAVRIVPRNSRHEVLLGRITEKGIAPKPIRGTAFLPTLFDIMDWDPDNKYRIRGIKKQKGKDSFLLFELQETEVVISVAQEEEKPPDIDGLMTGNNENASNSHNQRVVAYPAAWANSFGQEYYSQGRIVGFDETKWNPNADGTPYQTDEINPTGASELRDGIASIITTIKSGGTVSNEQ